MNGKRLILFSALFIICGCSSIQIKERYEKTDINGAKRNILNSLSVKINEQELILKSSNHKDPNIREVNRQEYSVQFSY
jgi:hypothetical protein